MVNSLHAVSKHTCLAILVKFYSVSVYVPRCFDIFREAIFKDVLGLAFQVIKKIKIAVSLEIAEKKYFSSHTSRQVLNFPFTTQAIKV